MTEEKKPFDVEDFMARFGRAQSPEQVDAMFAELSELGEERRYAAVDAIEAAFVRELKKDIFSESRSERAKILAEIKKELAFLPADEIAEFAKGYQMFARTFSQFYAVKGEAADPLTKAYMSGFSGLSSEASKSVEGLVSVFFNAVDAIDPPPAPKANPFHKPAGPKL